jgi:hypothetical protein
MGDIIDQANERAEQFLAHSLSQAAGGRKMKPSGQCYNCEEPLPDQQVFCDSDCRDDWQLRNPTR